MGGRQGEAMLISCCILPVTLAVTCTVMNCWGEAAIFWEDLLQAERTYCCRLQGLLSPLLPPTHTL